MVRKELAGWLPDIPGIRKTPTDNIHLTLLFLGDRNREERKVISESLAGIYFEPFEITVNRTGAFPDKRRPSIIWAGSVKNPELIRLQKDIRDRLSRFAAGNNRSFKPHFTLAKVSELSALNEVNIFKKNHAAISFHVTEFSLKKSTLRPRGEGHSVVKNFS